MWRRILFSKLFSVLYATFLSILLFGEVCDSVFRKVSHNTISEMNKYMIDMNIMNVLMLLAAVFMYVLVGSQYEPGANLTDDDSN